MVDNTDWESMLFKQIKLKIRITDLSAILVMSNINLNNSKKIKNLVNKKLEINFI